MQGLEAKWLAQFSDGDEIAARDLIESLRFVSSSAFERGIRKILESIDVQPLALFAVRELNYEVDNNSHYLGAFGDRDHNPLPVASGSVGSEGRIAHLISKLAAGSPGRYLDHPGIAKMARTKCRGIVVVDDLLGSGSRTRDFVLHLFHHRTITSWHSYGKIKFIAAAYAGTQRAISVVKDLKNPSVTVIAERGCPTLWDWGDKRIQEVCHEYASMTSRKSMPFGYGDVGSAIVFEHGCPNTAPAILWADKRNSWHALFPNRLVPKGMVDYFSDFESKTSPDSHRTLSPWKEKPVLLALFLREAGRRRKNSVEPILRLSIVTGLPISECSVLRELCIENGLLELNWRLTPAGIRELSRLRQHIAETKARGQEQSPYFPRTLRPRLSLANNSAVPRSGPECG